MFEPKSFTDIFTDLRGRCEEDGVLTDFEVGSVARTLVESFSYELALLHEKLHRVYLSAYVDTAEGAQLDLVVAILGLVRGEPDFAEGVVTFKRDKSPLDVSIPAGTLVSTEERPEAPKKVYRTTESATLAGEETSVKIQAVRRGRDEVTVAETLVVMPRPVPGVKSATNAEATVFQGKGRETDGELRRRAKNALISSGKATCLSIENALLEQPGVRDVKIVEPEDIRGFIEVYVDGPTLNDTEEKQRLEATVDRVRAAGILVQLKPTERIPLKGSFTLEAAPEIELSEGQGDMLETVRQAILDHVEGLKMGQSLIFSQLIRDILGVAGVVDLTSFNLQADGQAYGPPEKRIEINASERLVLVKDHLTVTATIGS